MVRFANTVEAISTPTPITNRGPGPCSVPAGIPSLTTDSSVQDMEARESPSNQEMPQRKRQPSMLPETICHNYWTHLENLEG